MSVENLKKHVGSLKNTGARIAVIFRKLPNDENNCLIIETARLPDSYHDAFMQILNARESYETNDLYEVLNRRTFPDGLNCLTALHQRGFLRKEPVSNVVMLPLPGQAVPLALINATIDKKVDQYIENQKTAPEQKVAETESEDPVELAKSLIAKADALDKESTALKERAYALAPDLKPGRGRPPTPEELIEQRDADRREKRRERDRARAEERKIAKAGAEIDAKVAAKLARDAKRVEETQAKGTAVKG